ncbi:hypothetical protein ABR763_26330 [Bacillus cereus]
MKIEFRVKLEINDLNGVKGKLFLIVAKVALQTILQALIQIYLGL